MEFKLGIREVFWTMACVCVVQLLLMSNLLSDRSGLYSNGTRLGWRASMSGLKEVFRDPPRPATAAELYSKVRVYCWVMTMPENIATKATAVWNTWGKRCNKVVFMTSQPTSLVPAAVLPVAEGREHLTAKTVHAFNYTYQHYLNEYDWFLKADDDTFVVVENMRYFLSKFAATKPSFYGYHFKTLVKQGYYSGGAGYVLSREALRRLVEDGFDKGRCRLDGTGEDVELGRCMETVGVSTGDSRDYLGRERFHPFTVTSHLEGAYPDWYYQYAYHSVWKGADCCSDVSVSFHYIPPSVMYLLDYTIYHLRAYGVNGSLSFNLNRPPPPRGGMRNSSDFKSIRYNDTMT